MTSILYIVWQDSETRRWYPVGKLAKHNGLFRFVYTKGASETANFTCFGRMTRLDAVYESAELFPLFANRLLSQKRRDYKAYLHWLGFGVKETDPIALLGRSEGIRQTDSLAMFLCPTRDPEGMYRVDFFSHGIRYLPKWAVEHVNELEEGERLYLMHDFQNPYDECALALKVDNPATIVGYCPSYFAQDFLTVSKGVNSGVAVVRVRQVNREAPIQLRLLCDITAPWPEDFQPCSSDLFTPLADEQDSSGGRVAAG